MLAFVLLSLLALALAITCLEYELRERLLARRGLYCVETLEERTGLDPVALHARLGPARPDGLRALSPADLAALPRQRRVDPWHPVPGAAATLGLVAGLVQALRTDTPPWAWLLAAGGYLLGCAVWHLLKLWREGLGPDDPQEQAELAGIDAYLVQAERQDVPLGVSCTRLVAACDQLEAGAARLETSCWTDPTLPLLPRLVAGSWASLQAWRARRARRGAEALLAEVQALRRELRDELEDWR